MQTWYLKFEVFAAGYEYARKALRRLGKLDPAPVHAEYDSHGQAVEVVFKGNAESQVEAVKRQNEIDEKLRTAVGDDARISFDKPTTTSNW